MRRVVMLAVLLLPLTASAQEAGRPHDHSMHGMPMDHMQMMHGGSMAPAGAGKTAAVPSEPGQAAFAAIQEIVGILEADPRTDWSKVDIEALRQHLVDMSNVTLAARVESTPVDGGMSFIVSGDGAVRDSIRRMISAHAATMDGVGGWRFAATPTDEGGILTVRVPPQDEAKLQGLGFIGVMARGMHHQEHHLMIARGEHPHH